MRARIEAAATSRRHALLRRGALHLSDAAARRCLARAHHRADELDLIVNVGMYKNHGLAEPALASLIQEDLGANPGDLNPYALDLVKVSWLLDQSGSNPNPLSSEEQSKFQTAIADADITVNPRYGTFDRKAKSFEESTPNWIKAGAEPEPSPTQG